MGALGRAWGCRRVGGGSGQSRGYDMVGGDPTLWGAGWWVGA